MKIDIEKLKEIEIKYQEQSLPTYTIHLMLSRVINYGDAPYGLASNNIVLSLETLKDLGILVMEDNKSNK